MKTKPEEKSSSNNGTIYQGQWHGRKFYFGFHHDLHVDPRDKEIGTRCSENELSPMLKLTGADFVQTDCKGHPGYTSWLSQTPTASLAPGIVRDALKQWRDVTKKLGLPLHCHYSGIYDKAAGAKHPDWCIVDKNGKPINTPGWYGPEDTGDKMCPRSPYVDELMIPQLLELIDNYNIDGFWIDGDTWGMVPCYCDRCRRAFQERTGIAEPPKDPSDPNWNAWWNFTRESFEEYVTHYCNAVHARKPDVLVSTSWLYGLRYPGEPKVPTDWISGDAPAFGDDSLSGEDVIRCDARFISTRGKPWDLMVWSFYGGFQHSTVKSLDMLQQQVAHIVAFGGNVQTCENPFGGVRTGRLIPWRLEHIGEVAKFIKLRKALCQNTKTIPQVAVLHSEHHFRSVQKNEDIFISVDVAPVRGAVLSLLECQYGVDILDEWALLPRLVDFPVVVAPEQEYMSEEMLGALKKYVENGGKLLVSGVKALDRFGGEFLGVSAGELVDDASFYAPAKEKSAQIWSNPWRLAEITTAECLAFLGKTAFRDEWILPNPAATLSRVGKGAVVYIPCNVFRTFNDTRFPLTRVFIHEIMRALAGPLDIEVKAPSQVDVVLRQKGKKKLVHLINRTLSKTQEGPYVGPITVMIRLSHEAKKVYQVFEDSGIKYEYVDNDILTVHIPWVHIHTAVVVED